MTTGKRIFVALLFAFAVWIPSAHAQVSEMQAVVGRPFGVGAVTFQVGGGGRLEAEDFLIEEKNGRVFYPVVSTGRLSRLLSDLLPVAIDAESGSRTIEFLFTGTEPLELTVHTPAPIALVLRADVAPPRNFERMISRWWRDYYSQSSALSKSGDYPPIIQTYLTEMLGQRLGLRTPLLSRLQPENKSQLRRTFDLLLATEDMHVDTMRARMANAIGSQSADLPVPPDATWTAPVIPVIARTDVEPMAKHVPQECFYVRFGSFENYLWLEDLLTSYGGDIGRMVTARGQDSKQGDRMRRQLSLPLSALAKIVGAKLIQDIALIGRDLYLEDGAAIGVMFHARNSALMSAGQQQQRLATALAEKPIGAALETISIAGHDVSFLSTPDNQIRSFYAVDGDFHLVTTSRAIVERFYAAGRGEGSLGDSPEFQHARSVFPLARNDTVFAFLSTSFFSGLVSPNYQIELGRRLQALADIELVQMASLAAAGEGVNADSIEALSGAGFLPPGFGRNADGSGPIVEAERVIDSKRGVRGSFTPIPDIELTGATAAEVAQYNERAGYFAQQWRQFDPLMVAIQRTPGGNGVPDRLTIDANISPLAEEKYGWVLSLLGPPIVQQIAPRQGDIISMQAHVTGGQASNLIPPHMLFVGVHDTPSAFELNPTGGLWQTLRVLRSTPGYLGAWPKPGFLDWLPLRSNAIPPDGFSRLLFDVWRWQGDGFSVLSFHRDVLENAVPQLRIEDADSPAQIRVRIGDLSQSQLQGWVNGMYYQRAWETSAANVRLLHSLNQQLRVPPDRALVTAEKILNTKLICPLGGTYELANWQGRQVWKSTAWETHSALALPPEYRAPLLQWFRGLNLNLTKSGDQLVVHSQVDMQPVTSEKGAPSLFDLFRANK
jgi:hypothetical protein